MKVELHVHTSYSYDTSTSLREIIAQCKKNKIDAIAITDHNEIEGALRLQKIAPFFVIVGEEILTAQGEVVGLFLKKRIEPGLSMAATIKEIKRQGGIVYLPHPFDHTTRKTAAEPHEVEKLIKSVDVVEIYNGRSVIAADNRKSLEFAKRFKKVGAVGSDAHTRYELGRNYQTMRSFSSPKDFVTALQSAKYTKAHVLYYPFILTKITRFLKKKYPISIYISKIPCDLCGGVNTRVLYKKRGIAKKEYLVSDDSYGVHPQIVQCLGCELIFASPRIPEREILKRYTTFKDMDYEKERNARQISQQRVLTQIEKYMKVGSLFEVGSATGTLIQAAITKGWRAVGIEPSQWAVSIAHQYKLPVYQTTLDKAHLKTGYYDVGIMVDVIEHLSSPTAVVSQMSKHIKKGGLICIITPDVNSIAARTLRDKWWHIRPDHIIYFTPESLSILLEKYGFMVIASNRYSWSFSYNYWISRFKNNIPVLFKILNGIGRIPIVSSLVNREIEVNLHDSMQIYAKKIG